MTRRLAIVPARGGSKRLPRKNIRDFCGKPMIAHTLQTACDSELFQKIHVSTEDDEIFDLISKQGFTPEFKRPKHLANDETPIMSVLKYVTSIFASHGTSFDEIWLLMACAPLVRPEDLRKAATLFQSRESYHPVLAVTEYAVPIEWAFNLGKHNKLTPVQPGMFATASNKISPRYYDTGTFAIFPSTKVLSSEGSGDDQNFIGYLLPRERGIDIDTEEDWDLAEAIFQYRSRLLTQDPYK